MKEWTEFTPKKAYLLCVDSDGCVIDGMTVKHQECFGPAIIDVWKTKKYEKEVLRHWNRMNLYSLKRGINRFQGISLELEHMVKEGWLQLDLKPLKVWVTHSGELSNQALEEEVRKTGSTLLRQVLEWSQLVNRKVEQLPPEKKKTFFNAKAALHQVQEWADVCVVSSANREAVMEEWGDNGLLENADVILTQEYGTKEHCIHTCLEAGYEKEKILMVGDAPGDLRAAMNCGVLFFGIKAGNEEDSWREFQEEVAEEVRTREYRRRSMERREKEFLENLPV